LDPNRKCDQIFSNIWLFFLQNTGEMLSIPIHRNASDLRTAPGYITFYID